MRRWMPLLTLLRLCAAAVLVYACHLGLSYIMERSRVEVNQLKSHQKADVYLGANSVKMNVINEDGQLAMEIVGQSVTLSQDQRNASFKDAQAKYFENGQPQLTISAGQIDYDTVSEDFHITKGDATSALSITTNDGWTVSADEVEWRQFKGTSMLASNQRPPSFRFPKGVRIESREGNVITASYMQADKNLQYMEFVGNFVGNIKSLNDTQFLTQRQLTDVNNLKAKDIENMNISAEQVIYDKRNQVLLATSRYYDRHFNIRDFDGQIISPAKYQSQPQQVLFSKPEARIAADHLEAHIGQKWAESYGHINMVLPPDTSEKHGEDKSLHAMKQYETKIAAGDIVYYWARDFVLSKDRTIVTQEDRRAEADQITYWGDKREVFLEGGISIVQGSGDWLQKADLVSLKDADQARMTKGYTEITGDRAVVYLNNNNVVADGQVMIRQDNREVAANTLVYEDGIKRLTARGDVKFTDVDGQSFMASALKYYNDSGYLQMDGGTAATIKLPAKYANDINRSIAESREQPAPAEVTDPPVPDEPTRNPNTDLAMNVPTIPSAANGGLGVPGEGPPPISGGGGGFVGPLPGPPANPPAASLEHPSASTAQPREMILNFGDKGGKTGTVGPVQSKPAKGANPPLAGLDPHNATTLPGVAKPPPQQPAPVVPQSVQPGKVQPQLRTDSNVAESSAKPKYQRDKGRQPR